MQGTVNATVVAPLKGTTLAKKSANKMTKISQPILDIDRAVLGLLMKGWIDQRSTEEEVGLRFKD